MKKSWSPCYFVDYQPTSENMVIDLLKNKRRLPEGIALFFKIARNRIFICRVVLQFVIIIHYNLCMQLANNKKIYFASDQHLGRLHLN
jgi:hypothetical protein